MKVQVTQENLKKALNIVSRIANSRGSLSILNNILIYTDNSRLILSSTNMDIAITEAIGGKVIEEGKICVPAKIITEIVNTMPKANIDIDWKDDKLTIKSGNYKSTINTVDPDDFPEIPEIGKATKLSIKSEQLITSIKQTAPFASNDASRPILTGVFINNIDGEIFLTATDGYRLAEKSILKDNIEIKAIIPASALLNVQQTIPDNVEKIDILINDEQISFLIDTITITSRLIAGNFIDYRQLIPEKSVTDITVDKTEFTRLVKFSSTFSKDVSDSITIKAKKTEKKIAINSIANEEGEGSAETEATITADGEITLNAKFLEAALNNFSGEEIKFEFSGKLTPSLLTDPSDKTYKHIIMPVRS